MCGIAVNITPRQIEVLRLYQNGKTTKEVAATLGISSSTVRSLESDTLSRLHAYNTAHAIVIALRCGWLKLSAKNLIKEETNELS